MPCPPRRRDRRGSSPLAALAALALALMALAAPMPLAAEAHPNWTATVAVTESGSHLLGNPDAAVKVAEYISYTCPHCAHFQRQSEVPMRIAYVQSGKVSLEMRHLVRDPVDLTAAILTNCGEPKMFFRNHSTILQYQEKWITVFDTATEFQKQRWVTGPMLSRFRAIANDFGFYTIMEQRGYRRTDLDRCLADEVLARRVAGQRQAAVDAGVEGTPSFSINGDLLAETHDWASLEEAIKARLNIR